MKQDRQCEIGVYSLCLLFLKTSSYFTGVFIYSAMMGITLGYKTECTNKNYEVLNCPTQKDLTKLWVSVENVNQSQSVHAHTVLRGGLICPK